MTINIKRFSLSTILGLTLGVFLAGYAVFAFTPPTQTPPDGNVEAPINVGPGDQIKEGGLWIEDWLFVDGGVRLGLYSTPPTCDATTKGTFIFDTTENKPYVCVAGDIWKPLDSDYDEDGFIDWFDPDDSNAAVPPDCIANNGGSCFLTQLSKSALDTDLSAGNILSGINIFGITGTVLPAPPPPPSCLADNGGLCYITQSSKSALDPDLASGNIKSGINIFGIDGTMPVGKECTITGMGEPDIARSALKASCVSYCGGGDGMVECDRDGWGPGANWPATSFNWDTCTPSNFSFETSHHGGGRGNCGVGDSIASGIPKVRCRCP